MHVYFFGVKDKGSAGHFLYYSNGSVVWSDAEKRHIPFQASALDTGLLPPGPQIQGKPHLAVINGWTVLSMWDRTGDTRPGCNASFIAEGVHDLTAMRTFAAHHFPVIWKRIQDATADEYKVTDKPGSALFTDLPATLRTLRFKPEECGKGCEELCRLWDEGWKTLLPLRINSGEFTTTLVR